MNIYVVLYEFKIIDIILKMFVYEEFQNRNYNKEEYFNVNIVVEEDEHHEM